MTQTETTTRESFTRLAVILGTAQYNENGIATISREMVGEIQLTLKDAQAEIDGLRLDLTVKDAQIAALAPKAKAWDADEALRYARGVKRSIKRHRAGIDAFAAQDEAHIKARRDNPPSGAERFNALEAAIARAREVNRG